MRHPSIITINVVVALLLVATNSVAAEWRRVGGNNNVVCYADPSSIKHNDGIATMKSLLDFTTAQTERSIGEKPYLSQRDEREYDCQQERYRLTHFALREGHMFAGAVVRSGADDGEWSPVTAGSLGQALWQFACKKK